MQENRKYKIWGIIGAIALFVVLGTYNYVRNMPFFNRSTLITAEFESISSLKVGSDVLYYGLEVGKVQDIYLNPENNHIMVDFDVKPGINLPYNTEAVAYVPNILYSARLELRFTPSDKEEFLQSGDIIPGSVGSYILDVRDAVDPYIKKVDTLVLKIFPTKDSIKQVIHAIESSISRVENGTASFRNGLKSNEGFILSIFDKANKMSDTLAMKGDSISLLLSNLTKSTDTWRKKDLSKSIPKIHPDSFKMPDLKTAQATLAKLNDRIYKINNNKDSSLAWLFHDTITKNKVIKGVEKTQTVVTDVRLHPEQYVNLKKKKNN